MASWLPPAKGNLPYYMLLLSIISIGNSAQNLLTLHYTRRMYNGRFVPSTTLPKATGTFNPEDSVAKLVLANDQSKGSDQATPLAARLFGTWTLITSIVRCYAAYHLANSAMYDLALWTYVVALGHFASEAFYFKTMTIGVPQMFPLTLATIALIWMPLVREHYVEF